MSEQEQSNLEDVEEAVRIVREQVLPYVHRGTGWGEGHEALETVLAALEQAQGENALHKRWHRKPTHGPCCTCQKCGLDYDTCRCSLDDVADELEKAEAALEAAGAWQADRAAVCEDRETAIRERDEARAETERLRKDVPTASQKVWREEANKQAKRADKAEAVLAAEREQTDAQARARLIAERELKAERERSERLLAALGFAYTELCEIERLNTSSKEQARHIFRAIGFCKWDKQPEWDERMTASLAPARAEVERLRESLSEQQTPPT